MGKSAVHIVLNDFVHDFRVLKECRTLLRAGYSVSVIALSREGLRNDSVEHGLRIRRLGLHTRRLPSYIKQFRIVQILGFLELLARSLMFSLRRGPVDVVHCHDLQALPLGVILKTLQKSRAIIYDAHELETEKKAFRQGSIWQIIARKLERLLIFRADACITVSKSIAVDYRKRYGCKEPHLVLNCPLYIKVLPKTNILRERLGISDNTRIFLYQGGLSKGRSIPVLLDIFEFDEILALDAVLVFIGYGELENVVKERAKMSANGIYFLSAVSPEELLPITASADIGLSLIENTCLSYFYSLPNKLYEYIMAGLCVIASDFPEMRKIVDKYSCGEVVNTEHPGEIVRVIQKVATADLKPYRKNARLAARSLCWERQEATLLGTYREVLEVDHQPPAFSL